MSNAARGTKGSDERSLAEPAQANPFKPRRGLFVAMSVLYAAWLVVLLALFFATVYPKSETTPATRPALARM